MSTTAKTTKECVASKNKVTKKCRIFYCSTFKNVFFAVARVHRNIVESSRSNFPTRLKQCRTSHPSDDTETACLPTS